MSFCRMYGLRVALAKNGILRTRASADKFYEAGTGFEL
jgi:hypothetical protein